MTRIAQADHGPKNSPESTNKHALRRDTLQCMEDILRPKPAYPTH